VNKRLEELLLGNRSAVAAGRAKPQPSDRRPTVAVLACTDERLVTQTIFDLPPGKIYSVRMAGNVYTLEVAGSLELAVVRLHCPLIVVLGHTDCTAVGLAHSRRRIEGREYEITRKIRPALEDVPPDAPLTVAVEANVRHTLRELRERDRLFRQRVEAGTLEIAGAICEIETGKVRLL